MKQTITTLAIIFSISTGFSQSKINIPKDVKFLMDSITKVSILNTLDTLFMELQQDTINPKYLTPKNLELTKSALRDLIQYESKKDSISSKLHDKQLMNIYPISENEQLLTISYIKPNENGLSQIQYIVNLVSTATNDKTTFAIPLDYLTRNWKTQKIGNTTYHFSEQIDDERGEIFDQKHKLIASNLGIVPVELDLYMVKNYQEFLKLFGFEYSISENGNYRNGYGVNVKTIFSVMNNEDFSHDMLHYYSGQINSRDDRNWVTEEGLAYSWGNAYYTDKNGEMITLERLKDDLKIYLENNSKTNAFDLFWNDTKIFNHIASEISVRSAISGLIMDKIQKEQGMEGVKKMMTAGRQKTMLSYLKVAEELIGINKENFDSYIRNLLYLK
jgi:hypothetical protein